MSEPLRHGNWKSYALVSIDGMIVVVDIAAFTRLSILTAIPIGFLFGFFLQKGILAGPQHSVKL